MKSSKQITSRSNDDVKKLRDVRDGRDKKLFFCEGQKVIEDLLQSKFSTLHLYATPKTESAARALLEKTKKTGVPVDLLAADIMDFVSDMSSAPGMIAVGKRPEAQPHTSPANALAIVLDGVQLPQNMGALMRTAEAAGVTDFFISSNSCDPYNPKVIRGSTGSVFRLRLHTGRNTSAILAELRAGGAQTIAAHQDGKMTYTQFDWTGPTALLVGSEGQGFSEHVLREVGTTVKIPMRGNVESLNVGVAAALCLFEATRQRDALEKR